MTDEDIKAILFHTRYNNNCRYCMDLFITEIKRQRSEIERLQKEVKKEAGHNKSLNMFLDCAAMPDGRGDSGPFGD